MISSIVDSDTVSVASGFGKDSGGKAEESVLTNWMTASVSRSISTTNKWPSSG